MNDLTITLTPEERADLHHLEGRVRTGWQSFIEVGEALLQIRERRLYRAEHRTWGDYVEAVWGWSRQRAAQLMDASETAHTLSSVGVTVENERQARDLKDAARIVETLEPEKVLAVAQYLRAATGTDKPTTSQVKAAAEVAASIDAHATVAHPDTGEEVPFAALTGEQRAAALAENVTTGTHERMQRQQGHIQASVQQKAATGQASWADWVMNHTGQLPEGQVLQITCTPVPGSSPTAHAQVIDLGTGAVLAEGDPAPYLKKAVMTLVKVLK